MEAHVNLQGVVGRDCATAVSVCRTLRALSTVQGPNVQPARRAPVWLSMNTPRAVAGRLSGDEARDEPQATRRVKTNEQDWSCKESMCRLR